MYYVYEITNNINHRTYTGVTSSLVQNGKPYMGSGVALRNAQAKYGIENFTRKILLETECEELAYFVESEMVDSNATKDRSNYNLNEGGKGGWSYVNRNTDRSGSNNGMYGKGYLVSGEKNGCYGRDQSGEQNPMFGLTGNSNPNSIKLPEEEIIQLYEDGYSSTQIADMFGVGKYIISRRLKKLGVKMRKGNRYSRKIIKES